MPKPDILIMPCILSAVLLYGIFHHVDLFSVFCNGAKKGLYTVVSILPAMVGLVTAVSMMRASGIMQKAQQMLAPLLCHTSFPSEVLPLALLKPVSGSGALALLTDIFSTCGTDSYIGFFASVLLGSSETTFYALAVYYGCIGVKNTRHTVFAAIAADVAGILSALCVCPLLYRLF